MKLLNENENKRETVDLEYDSLPVTLYGGRMDWDTGCYDERDVEISWTYTVDKQDIEEFLVDKILEDIPDDKAYEYVEEHYDELEEKYWQEILDHFEDDAKEDAQENNDEDYDTFGYDPDAEYDAWRDMQLMDEIDEDWKKVSKYTLNESLFENWYDDDNDAEQTEFALVAYEDGYAEFADNDNAWQEVEALNDMDDDDAEDSGIVGWVVVTKTPEGKYVIPELKMYGGGPFDNLEDVISYTNLPNAQEIANKAIVEYIAELNNENLSEAVDIHDIADGEKVEYKGHTIERFDYSYNLGDVTKNVESYVILSPYGFKGNDKTTYLPLYCEDENGEIIDFMSLQAAKLWLDNYADKYKLEIKNRDEVHAVINLNTIKESLGKKVKVKFECNECGKIWSETFDEDYFEDEEDLNRTFDESTNECPRCGAECFAIETSFVGGKK